MFDYSELLETALQEDSNSWRNRFDFTVPFSKGLKKLTEQAVILPYDHHEIITAYLLLPSALCTVLPYLFLLGGSGSGKSTIGKIAGKLYDVPLNGSGDTFAAIRNTLGARKFAEIEIPDERSYTGSIWKKVEINTCLIWDDIDPKIFKEQPNLFRLFKCGYDRSADRILIAGEVAGTIQEFHCFCPKILSSIIPLHRVSGLEELARRFLIIPFMRFEQLSEERKNQLGITINNFPDKIFNFDVINWHGIDKHFATFWDLDKAKHFLKIKSLAPKALSDLSSIDRQVSIDLLATGVASQLWDSMEEGINAIKNYWEWRNSSEAEQSHPLKQVIKDFLQQYINVRQQNKKTVCVPHSALKATST